MSTGKKVIAGAALGVAVPAAVGVAKKLIGNGGDDEQDEGTGQSESSQESESESGRSSPGSGVPVNRLRVEGGQADGDVVRPVGAPGAVTDPFAGRRVDKKKAG